MAGTYADALFASTGALANKRYKGRIFGKNNGINTHSTQDIEMSDIIEIAVAKTELEELIERAIAGEEIVIGRSGEPLVRLAPVPHQPKRAPRVPGRYKGEIWIGPDFEFTDEEITESFEEPL